MKMMREILKSLNRLERLLSEKQINLPLDQSDNMGDDWMDNVEVMEYLNISRSTFYRLQREKVIVARKVGKRSYFFKSDLMHAFMKSTKKGRL